MVSANNSGITPKSSALPLGKGSITGKKQTATVASRESGPLKTPPPNRSIGSGRAPSGPGKQGPADKNLSLTWGASVPILTQAKMRPVAK